MKDQISALIDGELPIENAGHLFIALKAKNEISESWATYHLIGDVMRGNAVFKPGFNERFMQKLDQEPSVLSPRNHAKPAKGYTKTSTAWSLAASVAAVMFVGWVVLQQQVHNNIDAAPAQIAQNVASEYVLAHQSMAPSSTAYYIQPASYSESGN
ncbi:MAG TPA: sigma-E factor negative regulatory protein [Methyloradius sp.]